MSEINAESAPPPVGPYPHARRVGNLLFVSGMGPRRAGSDEIPGVVRNELGEVIGSDIEAQTHAVMENLQAVLHAAGSSLDRVVDVTVFLTDIGRDFAAFNRVYAGYFTPPRPARTTVGVTSLPTPIAVELKVIATV